MTPIYHDIPLWGLWATDGACLIREGSPLPSGLWYVDGVERPWLAMIDALAHGLLIEAASKFAHPVARDRRFAARFGPVISGATRTASSSDALGAVAVWRHSDLVAVVMPLGYVESGTRVVGIDGDPR